MRDDEGLEVTPDETDDDERVTGDGESLTQFREYARTGDRRLRNQIVEQHRHLADRFAVRYRSRGIPVEDLRQTALLAMVRAVDRFDPDKGVSFATFASRTMDGELKRALRDKAWAVRPPRAAQERHLALRKREEELTHRLGRAPTIPELAEALDATIDEVLEAIEAGGARSAGGITRANDEGVAVDADELLGVRESGFELVDVKLIVEELMADLDDRERQVIQLRFYERLGQEEIAQRIGVSQSYLSRLLRKILLQMRERIEDRPRP